MSIPSQSTSLRINIVVRYLCLDKNKRILSMNIEACENARGFMVAYVYLVECRSTSHSSLAITFDVLSKYFSDDNCGIRSQHNYYMFSLS